ncbi:hypothetical protein BKA56DRAFT_624322 [Ilyonectria sp. MPI-CAGE-AT-0026]|nr:hypothetical protein BKA56DRAFT_624322 [Ilyonectria sp. MPI-CAGE-AT-0026]
MSQAPAASADDEARNVQRERNRVAQHKFRLRRQAAATARDTRLRQLEDTVEELSYIFVDLMDEILRTESVAKHHPALVSNVQKSAARFVALTNEIHAADGKSPPKDSGLARHHILADKSPASAASSESPKSDTTRVSSQPRVTLQVTPSSNLPPTHPTLTSASATLSETPTHIPAPASNSTPGVFPRVEDIRILKSPQALAPAGSFPHRLVQTTLNEAYLVLHGAVQVPEIQFYRTFGQCLRSQSREQLLDNTRYMLRTSCKSYMTSAAEMFLGLPGFDATCTSSKRTETSHRATHQSSNKHYDIDTLDFLSVFGVQKQLERLGARIIDLATMEITIPGTTPPVQHHSNETNDLANGSQFLNNSTSFVDLVPVYQMEPAWPAFFTMQLSIPILTMKLSEVAICFKEGPLYPKNDVAGAVQASVIMVQDDEMQQG